MKTTKQLRPHTTHSHADGKILLVRALSLAVTTFATLHASAHVSSALPGGGRFVAGSGAISGNGTSLTINQTSGRGVIDWTRFSIGKGKSVTFENGNGATLNRITGGDPSVIMGALSATGSIYLINPQGIVIGRSGVVSTGGRFVASTLDTDNASFLGGGDLKLTGSSKARIVNLGKIGSSHGDVFLVAADEIDNRGSITAAQGTAELAVGQQVLLHDSTTSTQVSVQVGSGGTVLNRGVIEAAQIGLQAADGNVFALSGKHEAIRATGTATRDGHVWLVADRGSVKLANTIVAKNADGTGGTVDTNAGNLTFCGCIPTVLAGVWNIATPSITLGAAAARAFSRSLDAGTSINLQTTGAYGRNGDVNVASNVGWNGAASLTLGAYRSVTINKGVTVENRGNGDLTLRADAAAIDNGGNVLNNGTVDWSKSRGIVSLLYDMNGSYTPGKLLGNASWTSPLYSGLVTQMTGYQLVNSPTDLQNIGNNLAGIYAIGKDFDAMWSSVKTPDSGTNTFTGQLDGMWHTISTLGGPLFQMTGGTVRDIYLTPAFGWQSNTPAGVVAVDNSGTIANVFVSGRMMDPTATFGDDSSFAGLVGTNSGLIARSGSNITVWVGGYGAGLAVNNTGTIVESYATGPVTEISFDGAAGGLVDFNWGTITQSYAAGAVSGTQITGGICGYCGNSGLTNDYWNVETTGQGDIAFNLPSSNGLTTAQMSNPASFVGWNFGSNGAWAMPAGATQPVLRWMIEHPGAVAPSI